MWMVKQKVASLKVQADHLMQSTSGDPLQDPPHSILDDSATRSRAGLRAVDEFSRGHHRRSVRSSAPAYQREDAVDHLVHTRQTNACRVTRDGGVPLGACARWSSVASENPTFSTTLHTLHTLHRLQYGPVGRYTASTRW